MKKIRMIKKDINQLVTEMLKGDEPCVCDNLEVLDALLENEKEFIVLDCNDHPWTKEKLKKLRSTIEFDPRGK